MNQDKRHWHANDSGILRKKFETNSSELLIFGYSCKLFRDDEKALHIDQGKHLIPWMGDETLKIDRYDVRGALSDLSVYEANDSSITWDYLTNEERKVELMCDEERYRALFHNEDEEALYQEEELKRLHQALSNDKEYGQVSYQYEEKKMEKDSKSLEEEEEEDTSDDQHEPFIPPAQLDVPSNMIIPETKKQNAIIEKTAMFINQQGPQMEILLKMKQASNPQFEFLSISCPLHPYYRHVLAVMKAGRYKPLLHDKSRSNNHYEYEDHYLHPSLLSAHSTVESAPLIPSISYKPSADCAYSMLVNKIKSKQESKFAFSTTTVNPIPNVIKEISSPPVMYSLPTGINIVDSDKFTDYTVNSISVKTTNNHENKKNHLHGTFKDKPYDNQQIDAINYEQESLNGSSDSIVNNIYQPRDFLEEPPEELKAIIDKMACYVVKNGRDFEIVVRSKGDPRFFFLNVGHQFHMYYEQRVHYFESLKNPVIAPVSTNILSIPPTHNNNNSQEVEIEEPEHISSSKEIIQPQESPVSEVVSTIYNKKEYNKSNQSRKSKVKKTQGKKSVSENRSTNRPLPVSFSIKKPKESDKLELNSALPVEDSSNEDEENEDYCSSKESSDKPNSLKGEDRKPKISMEKWAEERVKDKLAQAAKEKLALKEREKQLQLERKKRAQVFLNHLQRNHCSVRKPSITAEERNIERLPSISSSITSVSSCDSNEDDDYTHNSIHDKAQASQTLQRILHAVPKDNRNHRTKSKERPYHSHSYYRYRSGSSLKHHHRKSRKRHHTNHKSSHKHIHQSKSSRSNKRRKTTDSSSLSSD